MSIFKKIDGKPDMYKEDWTCIYDPSFELHGIERDFWDKIDTDMYNWSLKFPSLMHLLKGHLCIPLGTIFRLIFALLGSNHRHGTPMSDNPEVAYLWWDRPNWQRFLLWRFRRNPFGDLRKLFLGFGWAFYADKVWYIPIYTGKKMRFWIKAPYKIPLFPHFEYENKWEFDLGFKDRGIFSIGFHRN